MVRVLAIGPCSASEKKVWKLVVLCRLQETKLIHTYSALDLASGYWQLEMDHSHREKTAPTRPSGLYELDAIWPVQCLRHIPETD